MPEERRAAEVTGGPSGPAIDPRAEAVRVFGRYLLRERELRGLTPDDVARVTKLAPAVIDSIESGDPERMPPRGYLVGYLRSYSAAVGLDADDVVLRFQEAAGVDEPETAPGGRPAARPAGHPTAGSGPARRWWIVAAVLALVVAAAVAIGFRRSGGDPGEIRGRKSTERAPYRAPGAP
jgi:cytoskeletal protein RodZ